MIVGDKLTDSELIALVPSIKNYMNEWQIISVVMREGAKITEQDIQNLLWEMYKKNEGIVYTQKSKVICLVRLGIIEDYYEIKSDVEKKMPKHSCRVMAQKVSKIGLRQIQIDLLEKDDTAPLVVSMLNERKERRENIFLVVDDDAFARKALGTLLATCGLYHEAQNGAEAIKAYVKANPDIIFLDIHMPDCNGLELIADIFQYDPDAFIIVMSADSVRDNVVTALDKGAAGFLAKPSKRDAIMNYLNACLTVR